MNCSVFEQNVRQIERDHPVGVVLVLLSVRAVWSKTLCEATKPVENWDSNTRRTGIERATSFQSVKTERGRSGRPHVTFCREEDSGGGGGASPRVPPETMLQQSEVLAQVGSAGARRQVAGRGSSHFRFDLQLPSGDWCAGGGKVFCILDDGVGADGRFGHFGIFCLSSSSHTNQTK